MSADDVTLEPAKAGDAGHTPDQIFTAGSYTPFGDKHGLWGEQGSADTSGFSGLNRTVEFAGRTTQPFGGWFDQVADRLNELVPGFSTGQAMVFRGELTLFVRPEKLLDTCRVLRDDQQLRFEVCYSVSGVHYPEDAGQEFHAVYHLMSYTHNRRLRLEVTCPADDPHIPSVTLVYPMTNYHERETFDMFGIIFDGHPALTRILMPDDWDGFPQRKDYPLGGIAVEFKGAEVAPTDRRRKY